MVVDERSRHELYTRLEELLGPEAATTLIEHLPPVGWADVATKHDFVALDQRMELRFARIDDRFVAVDARFDHMEARFDERFNLVDERFNVLHERFTALDEKFNLIDVRFGAINDRFGAIDEKFNLLDVRFGAIDEKFVGLGWRFDGLDDRMKGATSDLRATFEHELRAQTTTMVFGLVSVVLTMAALAFALVRFT